jgi:glycosyltransferase involved in cell wall biosynthesis
MQSLRLAVVSTHPIQYYAPIFRALAASTVLKPRVFYTWSQTASGAIADAGFGRSIEWDIPLLAGYEYQFVPNVARRPGPDHFWGLQNPTLNQTIAEWRPNAILVFGWNSVSNLSVLRYFKGRVPVFFRGDSTLLDGSSAWRRTARRRFLSWVYRHIDVAIAVGSNNRDYYLWCGVPPARIAFAPHGIDVERFGDRDGFHESRAREWRLELGIAPESRVVLFAGKLIPKKDPLLLLGAFVASGCGGHLLFAGNGALEEAIRHEAGDRRNIHFLSFQNQQVMPAVYRLGDVFLLPSRGPGETWGLALNEAMASGRPVIASSMAGATRDLVREGINGWHFQAGSLEQLSTLIRKAVMAEPDRLKRMGGAAQEDSRKWSTEAAARAIEAAIAGWFDAVRCKTVIVGGYA